MLQKAGAVFALIVVFALGMYIQDWRTPELEQPDPDTVYADTKEPDTTISLWTPNTVVVHDTITDVRYEEYPVPMDMNVGGLVSDTPIRRDRNWLGPDDLVFTKFDPESQQYIQERYSFDRSVWSFWPEITLRSTPLGFELAGTANFRYKTLILEGGYSVWEEHHGVTIGITWRPVKIP